MSRPEYHFYLNFWMGVHIGKPWVSIPVVWYDTLVTYE